MWVRMPTFSVAVDNGSFCCFVFAMLGIKSKCHNQGMCFPTKIYSPALDSYISNEIRFSLREGLPVCAQEATELGVKKEVVHCEDHIVVVFQS